MESILRSLGFEGLFVVNLEGRSGGLAMLWHHKEEATIIGFSAHHIDVVTNAEGVVQWRLTVQLTNLEISSLDHCPIDLDPKPRTYVHVTQSFQFENSWLKEPLCAQIVSNNWEVCASMNWEGKMDHCSQALLAWAKEITGNFRIQLKNCMEVIQKLKRRRDVESHACYKSAKENLMEILCQKEIFWHQRSKQLWLKAGDFNSKYFHANASARRGLNMIHKLQKEDGN
ncbi:uncharacterized protein LOC133785722 [Humulus lupulus]|uniref:uncharacterized protein LOC133785722 n=1 Tax=Humulus lupulus TaxID=3486 RepID=UPI002B417080|nr:uncharacterized protein LOC133785722 [Humulus lupulus]